MLRPPLRSPLAARALALTATLFLASAPVRAGGSEASGSSAAAVQTASAPKRDRAKKFWAHPIWQQKGARFIRAAFDTQLWDFRSPVLAPQWNQTVEPAHGAELLHRIVDEVRERAKQAPAGNKPYVVFDLDDTAIDGRPRIAGAARIAGLPDPTAVETADLESIFSKLPRTRLNRIKLRIFSDQYYHSRELRGRGEAMPGAIELIKAIEEAGGEVLYHTARDPSMREETLALIAHTGLPLRDPDRNLVMGDRTGSKLAAARRYAAERGEPVAAFDNEPHNAIAFRTAFRRAHVARLASTAFSSAPEPPAPWMRMWILSSLKLDGESGQVAR
jgi:hypothetical protein